MRIQDRGTRVEGFLLKLDQEVRVRGPMCRVQVFGSKIQGSGFRGLGLEGWVVIGCGATTGFRV